MKNNSNLVKSSLAGLGVVLASAGLVYSKNNESITLPSVYTPSSFNSQLSNFKIGDELCLLGNTRLKIGEDTILNISDRNNAQVYASTPNPLRADFKEQDLIVCGNIYNSLSGKRLSAEKFYLANSNPEQIDAYAQRENKNDLLYVLNDLSKGGLSALDNKFRGSIDINIPNPLEKIIHQLK